MNLESLKNIGGRIETENKKEKEETLFEKIERISLIYADKKFQEIKKDKKDYKFSEAIKDFAPIENIILRPIFHLDEFNLSEYKEKIDLFLNDFYGEINFIYEINGFDLDKVSNLVSQKKDSIKKYLGVEGFKEFDGDKKERETKVLNFNKIINIETDAEKRYKNLEELGFSKSDHFVEIHVEDFYKTGAENLGPELIRNDLGVVAEHIIDKEPEAVAVIGKSWLLSTPLANRLGFKKIEDDTTKQNDFSTWLQFIDKNGQIDKKRFNEFLKTGELPYKSTKAYMLVEEFLKKYLPENRRGKVILKEINNDKKDFWDKMQKEAQLIKTGWDDLLKNNGNFEDFIENNKTLNELLDFVAPENKKEYLDFFRMMYDKKIPWTEFYKYKSDNLKKFDEKINKKINDDLYIPKEVYIE